MILWPTLAQVEAFCSAPCGLAVDIECAGMVLTQINLARLDTLESMPVRLRGPDAVPWPWGGGWPRLVSALWEMLANPHLLKVGHNWCAFDDWVLHWNGFKVEGLVADTLLLGHLAFPGMQSGLGLENLSTSLLALPFWKHLSADADGEGK